MNQESSTTPMAAPADRRAHGSWSLAAKIGAYLVLGALAVASVWLIDRRVDALAEDGVGGISEAVDPMAKSMQTSGSSLHSATSVGE